MVTGSRVRAAAALVLLIVTAAGCREGRGGIPAETSAESLFESGVAAAEKGNCATAVSSLTTALNSGRLTVDLIDDALIARAKCHAAEGRYDAALADLDVASQGGDDPSAVHLVRAEVLLKQGEKGLAKAEFGMAKKLNPKAKPPAGL